jgi:hypothetical protein
LPRDEGGTPSGQTPIKKTGVYPLLENPCLYVIICYYITLVLGTIIIGGKIAMGKTALIHFRELKDKMYEDFDIHGTPCECPDAEECPEGLLVKTKFHTDRGDVVGSLMIPWIEVQWVFYPEDPAANLGFKNKIGFIKK